MSERMPVERIFRLIAQGVVNISEMDGCLIERGSDIHEAMKALCDPDIADRLQESLDYDGTEENIVRDCPACGEDKIEMGTSMVLPSGSVLLRYSGSYQCHACETQWYGEPYIRFRPNRENVKNG